MASDPVSTPTFVPVTLCLALNTCSVFLTPQDEANKLIAYHGTTMIPEDPPIFSQSLSLTEAGKLALKSDGQTLSRVSLTISQATSTMELPPLSTETLPSWTLQTSSMFLGKSVLHEVTPVLLEMYESLQYSSSYKLSPRIRRSSSPSSAPLDLSHPDRYRAQLGLPPPYLTTLTTAEDISFSLASKGEQDTSSMAWKPPWVQVLYTSITMLPPGELSIDLVRISLMQSHPQATAAATLDPSSTKFFCLQMVVENKEPP